MSQTLPVATYSYLVLIWNSKFIWSVNFQFQGFSVTQKLIIIACTLDQLLYYESLVSAFFFIALAQIQSDETAPYPRKGRLLRSITTKVCSQISRKWNAMLESSIQPCSDQHWQDKIQFWFEDFLSNLPSWAIIYCVTDQLFITWSPRSVLNFKFSDLTFLRLMSCSMSIEQNLCAMKIFQLQSMSNAITYIDKRYDVKNSVRSCVALIFNLGNPRIKSRTQKMVKGC